jgi:hypothetical protein
MKWPTESSAGVTNPKMTRLVCTAKQRRRYKSEDDQIGVYGPNAAENQPGDVSQKIRGYKFNRADESIEGGDHHPESSREA